MGSKARSYFNATADENLKNLCIWMSQRDAEGVEMVKRRIVILCIDGLGPDYLEEAQTPNMDRMAKEGCFTVGDSVIPSVTNVNNVSIITGVPPRLHGITSNYWLDRKTGQERYMESPEFLRHPTLLQRAKGLGMSTALLTSKTKLLHLLNAGADYSLSAEDPDEYMVERIGAAKDIYSPEINIWLLRALRFLLKEKDPEVVYCATTDGMMHRYGPDQEGSLRHVSALDSILGDILEDNPDREIYLTADHGMSAKTRGVDIERTLMSKGIRARAIPIIKDRYVVHHRNLGGSSYIYLEKGVRVQKAANVLRDVQGIEEVYLRREGARKFDLMEDRIGDLFVLGDGKTVFGEFESNMVAVNVRSHGSRHEGAVPILAYGRYARGGYHRNFDLVARLGLQ